MLSNAPVKRYSPVRKSSDHRSIGTHIIGTDNDMSDNGSNYRIRPNKRTVRLRNFGPKKSP